jgi:hypothetical protein
MIGAWIVELLDGGATQTSRGFFQFAQLPAPGDRVMVMNHHGSRDVLGVVLVEHAPVPAEPGRAEPGIKLPPATEPTATVYVQWLTEDGEAPGV